MKNIYLKIVAGVLVFGSALILNPGFFSDIDVFMAGVVCFLLPSIVLNHKRLYFWVMSYIALALSIWYFTVVPTAVQPSTCGSILCGMDGRPFYALFAYIGIIIILGFLQLIHFLQNGKSKKELKSQIK